MKDRTTIFSPCRKYRYTLWREFDMLNDSYAMFIGLNPSTADEQNDDPTIRRCVNFAKDWGYGALCMTNAFAFRATNPAVMMNEKYPIGKDNDSYLLSCSKNAGIVIAAWGVYGEHKNRDIEINKLIPELYCLGTTMYGLPRHPLYIKRSTKPIIYNNLK